MKRAAVAAVLLFAPVFVLAGRLPGLPGLFDALRGLPAEAALDYSRLATGFAPLSAEYFSRLYGAPPSIPVANDRSSRGSLPDLPGPAVQPGGVGDSFDDAVRIGRVPFASGGDTRTATREPNEPGGCSRLGGTVWYRYDAPASGRLMANTFGSNYPTSLGVYRGTSLASLTQTGCMTDPRGLSYVAFSVERGARYYMQVGGAVGGDLKFVLEEAGRAVLASTGPTDRPRNSRVLIPEGEESHEPGISADGRYVTFTSDVPIVARSHEACACSQIFLRDLRRRTTVLVSAAPGGAGGNARSDQAQISADGRFVVFRSAASDLVKGDTNEISDIFLRDVRRGTTTRVSVTPSGEQAQPRVTGPAERGSRDGNRSFDAQKMPVISADGGVIAFMTQSPNLSGIPREGCVISCFSIVVVDRTRGTLRNACPPEPGQSLSCSLGSISSTGRYLVYDRPPGGGPPTPFIYQVYLKDLKTGEISLVSKSSTGEKGNADSRITDGSEFTAGRHVSADGRWIAFSSKATNFAAGDTENSIDNFVHDRLSGVTIRVTPPAVDQNQTLPNAISISDDGRIVAFSGSGHYVPEDYNEFVDVYVVNLITRQMLRLSVTLTGDTAGGRHPAISADGSAVAFSSYGLGITEDDSTSDGDVFVRTLPRGFR